jgi:hypothetical protein
MFYFAVLSALGVTEYTESTIATFWRTEFVKTIAWAAEFALLCIQMSTLPHD